MPSNNVIIRRVSLITTHRPLDISARGAVGDFLMVISSSRFTPQ